MCHNEARANMSQEEQAAAEESLSVYCKPVELYNILQRRAVRNPSFIRRNLHYILQEKQKRRIQISVSISGAASDGQQTQSLFPLYVLVARPVSTAKEETQSSAVYRFNRACKLTVVGGVETSSSADTTNSQGIDLTEDHMFSASLNPVGYCLFGKIPMDIFHSSWEKSPTLSLGGRAEMTSPVIMQSCYMKVVFLRSAILRRLDGGKCVSFHFPYNSEAVQVPVNISAEEVGAKYMSRYDAYSYNDSPKTGILRLRSGNVIFNYKYYNNTLQRTEVTSVELLDYVDLIGLRFHLTASHDIFHYEFWATEDYQVVIVSMRTDISSSEMITETVDPKQQTFFSCYKPTRRRKPKSLTQNANNVHPLVLDSAMSASLPMSASLRVPESMEHDSPDASATGHPITEPESVQSVLEENHAPPAMLQFAKTRKLSAERYDPRLYMLYLLFRCILRFSTLH
ncbi:hypothetical protein Tco_0688805 [Tanacetum coccineum]